MKEVKPVEHEGTSADTPKIEWVGNEVLLPRGRFAVSFTYEAESYHLFIASEGLGANKVVTIPLPVRADGFVFVPAGVCADAPGTEVAPFLLASEVRDRRVSWATGNQEAIRQHGHVPTADELRCAFRAGVLGPRARWWWMRSEEIHAPLVTDGEQYRKVRTPGHAWLRIARAVDASIDGSFTIGARTSPWERDLLASLAKAGRTIEVVEELCGELVASTALQAAHVPPSSVWIVSRRRRNRNVDRSAAHSRVPHDKTDDPGVVVNVRTAPDPDAERLESYEPRRRCRGVVTKTSIETIDVIYFTIEGDEIHTASFPILDEVAATLQGNPSIRRLEIQGHSYSEQKEQRQAMSVRRAEAVARYLTDKGVERTRLVVVGYGDTSPWVCPSNLAEQVRAGWSIEQLRTGGEWADYAEDKYLLGQLREWCANAPRGAIYINSRVSFIIRSA